MRRLTRDVLATLPEGTSAPDYLDDEPRVGIVHFGVGNFHRAHQAMYLDRLMHAGLAHDWAICGVGLLERDARMRDALTEQDGLYTLTLRHPDGRDEIEVIGSIRRFLHAPDDPDAVLEQLADPGVRIVSLTITEGGYVEDAANGRRAVDEPLVRAETAEGLTAPRTAFGWIVAGLRERRRRGVPAFTVLCCDNIQGNGEVARRSVEAVARLVDEELADWIAAEVAFPSTMVDRITPVTTPADVERIHERLGVHDAWPVASEPFTQWVIEDRFPTGRPPYEQVGATLVTDVHAYEAIKLRLLNAGHQAVAYIGRLAGYELVDEAITDPRIAAWVRRYMEREGVPTLTPPEGFDLPGYIDELFARFGNANVADTLARLGTDASNRIPKFVVPTLRDRIASGAAAETGAELIASWRAFTRRAAAGEFSLDDESADQLMQAAAGAPLEFLALPTLAGLADSAGFRAAYLDAVVRLENGGADAFLEG
ncbi:mannitol dehydrogenase family protein [Homoserinibacter gongjuensis]|uniref:Mannitol-1-phosphate 5-dehydrogenase n=1 Tax=Homoserinibacter gongjuensis TaxID=1162968 RepID=A0ABQ6JRA9_9MICO|nr:mannitol dehydrogenase family protein [Homoserinibacter gongjuensis]GMA89859.1 mannitol 2-dehydrogenase [Homoserinibacter gongjuensis]